MAHSAKISNQWNFSSNILDVPSTLKMLILAVINDLQYKIIIFFLLKNVVFVLLQVWGFKWNSLRRWERSCQCLSWSSFFPDYFVPNFLKYLT